MVVVKGAEEAQEVVGEEVCEDVEIVVEVLMSREGYSRGEVKYLELCRRELEWRATCRLIVESVSQRLERLRLWRILSTAMPQLH